MSDSDIETMPSSDTVHEASRGDDSADVSKEIDNTEVSEAEKYDKTRINDVHNTVQEHKGSDDTDALPYSTKQEDSKDNVNSTKKNFTELNGRQSDEVFSADPIDLVLQEIGEQVTSAFSVLCFFSAFFIGFLRAFFRTFFIFFHPRILQIFSST